MEHLPPIKVVNHFIFCEKKIKQCKILACDPLAEEGDSITLWMELEHRYPQSLPPHYILLATRPNQLQEGHIMAQDIHYHSKMKKMEHSEEILDQNKTKNQMGKL